MKKIGFDSQMYMQKQSEQILERISKFDKLYLEFGGKLFDDLHAARVMPGSTPRRKSNFCKSSVTRRNSSSASTPAT